MGETYLTKEGHLKLLAEYKSLLQQKRELTEEVPKRGVDEKADVSLAGLERSLVIIPRPELEDVGEERLVRA